MVVVNDGVVPSPPVVVTGLGGLGSLHLPAPASRSGLERSGKAPVPAARGRHRAE